MIWDLDKADELASLMLPAEGVNSLSFHPDGKVLASGGQDGRVILWDMDQLKAMATLHVHARAVDAVAFSPDGSRLATSAQEEEIIVWDWPQRLPTRIPLKNRERAWFAFDAKGTLAAVTTFGNVRLARPRQEKFTGGFAGSPYGVYALAFSPDGNRLAGGGQDTLLHLWRLPDGKEEFKPQGQGHQNRVNGVAASSDGRYLASSSMDHTLRFWDAQTGREANVLSPKVSFLAPNVLRFHPDGMKITSLCEYALRSFEVPGGREWKTYSGPTSVCPAFVHSPDGRWLACGGGDNKVWVWNVDTAHAHHVFDRAQGGQIFALAFRGDSQLLAAGGQCPIVRCWNLADATHIDLVTDHVTVGLVFSLDGTHLLVADNTGRIIGWDVQQKREDGFAKTDLGAISCLTLHPRGDVLAVSNREGRVFLIDYPSGKVTRTRDLPGEVYDVTFTADGRHLCTANGNGTIYVIRLAEAPLGPWIGR